MMNKGRGGRVLPGRQRKVRMQFSFVFRGYITLNFGGGICKRDFCNIFWGLDSVHSASLWLAFRKGMPLIGVNAGGAHFEWNLVLYAGWRAFRICSIVGKCCGSQSNRPERQRQKE